MSPQRAPGCANSKSKSEVDAGLAFQQQRLAHLQRHEQPGGQANVGGIRMARQRELRGFDILLAWERMEDEKSMTHATPEC
jgi:hypothetical protein